MKKKLVFTGILVAIITAVIVYNYVYQDHRDIKTEKESFSVSAIALAKEFETNLTNAENKYLNKTISIKGVVSEVNENSIMVNNKIFCLFENLKPIPIKNSPIHIKGRLIGYDDILEEVKIDQCNIVTK